MSVTRKVEEVLRFPFPPSRQECEVVARLQGSFRGGADGLIAQVRNSLTMPYPGFTVMKTRLFSLTGALRSTPTTARP
jgi:hypothetical protein